MPKYPRTFHLPYSKGATSDDKISNNTKLLIGIDIIISEKLDGSNSAFTNDGVYGRSHIEFSKNPWDRGNWDLFNTKVKGNLEDGVFIFGEGMEGIHSIEYSKLTSYFYIFGVRDNNIWIPWEGVEEYSYLLDIPTVPVLFKGVVNSEKELKQLVEGLVIKPSSIGGQIEGVVVRNASLFHNDYFADNVMKWVRKDHVTTGEHWTRNWKRAKLS